VASIIVQPNQAVCPVLSIMEALPGAASSYLATKSIVKVGRTMIETLVGANSFALTRGLCE
jgi:hypothetical protein